MSWSAWCLDWMWLLEDYIGCYGFFGIFLRQPRLLATSAMNHLIQTPFDGFCTAAIVGLCGFWGFLVKALLTGAGSSGFWFAFCITSLPVGISMVLQLAFSLVFHAFIAFGITALLFMPAG